MKLQFGDAFISGRVLVSPSGSGALVKDMLAGFRLAEAHRDSIILGGKARSAKIAVLDRLSNPEMPKDVSQMFVVLTDEDADTFDEDTSNPQPIYVQAVLTEAMDRTIDELIQGD